MLGKGVGGAACTEEHVLVMGHGMCEGHAHIEKALHARAGVWHPLRREFHVRDAGRVEAQRLVERRRLLPRHTRGP